MESVNPWLEVTPCLLMVGYLDGCALSVSHGLMYWIQPDVVMMWRQCGGARHLAVGEWGWGDDDDGDDELADAEPTVTWYTARWWQGMWYFSEWTSCSTSVSRCCPAYCLPPQQDSSFLPVPVVHWPYWRCSFDNTGQEVVAVMG